MFDPKRFASDLVRARRDRELIDPGLNLPTDTAQAYAVQAMVAAELGPVGAFKCARKPDTDQVHAPILAADIGPSGSIFGAIPGDTLAVELELGLRLLDDPPAPGARDFTERLAALVEPVAVIELVGTRMKGEARQHRLAGLADNQSNAALVLGSAAPPGARATATVHALLRSDNGVILDGEVEVPGGHPLAALQALAETLGAHCGGLRKGQIVLTGSLHPMVFLPTGTKLEGSIEGVGTVQTIIG